MTTTLALRRFRFAGITPAADRHAALDRRPMWPSTTVRHGANCIREPN